MRTVGDRAASALALAERFLELEQYERALDAVARADFEDPEAWAARTRAELGLSRFADAERSAALGLERDPQHSLLLYALALARYRGGNLAGAEQAVLAALQVDPEWVDAICLYGELVASAGQFAKAERLLAEGERIDPERGAVLRLRHLLDTLQQKRSEAVESARQLVAHDPENAHSLLALGYAEHGRGDAAEGLGRMRAAAALDPELATAHYEALVEARLQSHPLMAPLRLLQRTFGEHAQVATWLIAVGGITWLRSSGSRLAGALSIGWLAFCLYTWITPPLLRRWLARGR
jgi:tetratricopeptide (TPR) repeat protein